MKISILQENFKKALQIVSRIAGKNINLPILNNILLKTLNGNIVLTTTDLELGVVSKVRGKIDKEGSFTIDSKLLLDYITLLPNRKINIEQIDKKIVIQSDNYKTAIKGTDSEDFPLIPKIEKKNSYKIKISDFKKALSQIIFAVSVNETRVELSGVLFYFKGSKLTLVATDSYRLAEKTIDIQSETNNEKKVIIPSKTLQEVVRILSIVNENELDSGVIELYLSENQIMFSVENTEIVSRLIEGQYPDYEQIIPTKHETKIKIEKDEFIRAIKTSSIFSRIGINDINLDFPGGKNKTIISSTSSQSGENIVELESEVMGIDNGIVVNYKYLLDGINNINSQVVELEVINSNTPCILKPENDDSYIYVVMPIKQ
jgi:DNA polymerase III subunit beta